MIIKMTMILHSNPVSLDFLQKLNETCFFLSFPAIAFMLWNVAVANENNQLKITEYIGFKGSYTQPSLLLIPGSYTCRAAAGLRGLLPR